MNKRILTSLMFFLVPVMCFAQVKNYVGVVHPVFSESTVEFLKEFSAECYNSNQKNLGEAIDDYINGGSFGSGFVYVTPDGKNYIITNRHVAQFAKTVNVDFINEDGSKTVYEGLTIVALGKELDIAVLAFPEGVKPFKLGLSFETRKVNDGDSVWTAGFPAFEGKPAWQFGTGTVTNNSAAIESMVNPEITTVIQHSAQIDSGSSGGPLLVKNENAVSGYTVIGINTWKATKRQDTNFSIPAKAMKQFVDDAIAGKYKGTDNPEEVSKQAASFAETIAKRDATYADVFNFISMEYIHQFGAKTFKEVLNECPRSTFSDISSAFVYGSPVDGFRYAIAWKIWNEFHLMNSNRDNETVPTFKSPEKMEGTERYKVIYTLPYKDGSADIEWINEYGTWMIYSFKNNNEKAHNNAQRTKDAVQVGSLDVLLPYTVAFSLNSDIAFNKDVLDYKGVPLNFTIEIASGIGNVFSQLYGFDYEKFEDFYRNDIKYENAKLLGIRYGLQLQLPMTFGAVTVMPFGNASLKPFALFYDDNSGYDSEIPGFSISFLSFELQGGIRGIYTFDSNISLLMDVAYKYSYLDWSWGTGKPCSRHGLTFGLGVAF